MLIRHKDTGALLYDGDGKSFAGLDLRGASWPRQYFGGSSDFRGADLRGTNFRDRWLRGADLRGADLRGAIFDDADMVRANLSDAKFDAETSFRWASLFEANLSRTDLSQVSLHACHLAGADLIDAILPDFQLPQDVELIGWKKISFLLSSGPISNIVKLRIPPEAKRTAALVGAKCRAEYAEVLEGEGRSLRNSDFIYSPGEIVRPDSYDPDIRVECTHGIHFFKTLREAARY